MPRRKNQRKKQGFNYRKHMDTASKALSIALATKKLLNVETKYHDLVYNTTVSNSGDMQQLSLVPQGDTQITRDGSSLKTKSVTIRFLVSRNGSASNTSIRMILFRGKKENGNVPVVADILESTTLVSPKTHDKRFNTKFLMDKHITLNTMVSGQGNRKYFQVSFPLDGHITFDGSATTVTDGGLYLYLISNEATNTPTVNFHSRVTFLDN